MNPIRILMPRWLKADGPSAKSLMFVRSAPAVVAGSSITTSNSSSDTGRTPPFGDSSCFTISHAIYDGRQA